MSNSGSSKRVAVFGPSGMLGRQVVKALTEVGYTPQPIYRRMADLVNRNSIQASVQGCDAIINCAGMIPIKNSSIIDMINVNSVFPHILASCGLPTILMSTDCVFSGRSRDRYTTTSLPDPRDYYGRSKALGEVMAPNVCVVRSSFIGCEHGFMNWVMSAGLVASSLGVRQRIDGWKNALWTGSTVIDVARALVGLLNDDSIPIGIVHLATEQVINKYDLATKIAEIRELNIEVVPCYQPILNRALQPTHMLGPLDTALANYKCTGAS